MKLNYFFTLLIAFVALFAACNDNNETTIENPSSDGQIVSFKVSAYPKNATDSLTYPYLAKTKFTVLNAGAHRIFNLDSLPVNTEIKTLKVELGYTATAPIKVDLVYKDKDMNDSIPEEIWNGEDSVKFFKIKNTYYPLFKTIAQDGTERLYTVDFRIHTQDPDSIVWNRVKLNNDPKGKDFDLPVKGESKVFKDFNEENFIAFVKDGNVIKQYSSSITDPTWVSLGATDLPADAILKNMLQTAEAFVVNDAEGNVYTAGSAGGLEWKKETLSNIKVLLGQLPEVEETNNPKNEFLFLYEKEGKLKYGKTQDFQSIESLKISTRGDSDEIIDGFPVKDFTSVNHSFDSESAIVLVGGLNQEGELVKRSWRITNVALSSGTEKAEIRIFPGNRIGQFPPEDDIASFIYDNKLYAMSTDSLELYHSATGDKWQIADEKQNLSKEMQGMGKPSSVLVDKDNYIWVFGGVSKNSTYSQMIWRGRLNKLAPR